jgi:hypothetical protein
MIPRLALILAVLLPAAARAADSFSQSLSPADFQAAGLSKLTPDELARLDALVRGEKVVAASQAAAETTKVVTATVRQQVQAEDRKAAQQKAASSSILERMRVVLKPGTEIEYTTLDAVLVPPFHGWQPGTRLTLTNGQRWIVTDDGSYWADRTMKPVHVKIVPGIMGSFFMEIEHGGRPRVKFLGNMNPPAAPTPTP